MRTFNFEENLEKIEDLLRYKDYSLLAIFFLNTLESKEKENLISALKIKREKNIASGYYDSSVRYSAFLNIKFTTPEINKLLKDSIFNGYMEDAINKAEKLFLVEKLPAEDINTHLLTLSKEMKSLKGIKYFSEKLNIPIEKDVLEEILKQNIQWGSMKKVEEITKMLNRALTQREKTQLFKKASLNYLNLEEALTFEQFCNQKIPNSWFLEQRKKAIDEGKYNLALTLSKITNRKIKNADLEKMLDKLICDDYITEKQKKELKSLEKHFPYSYVLAKKLLALQKDVEDGNLEYALNRAQDLGRNLSTEEFKTIFKTKIQFSINEKAAKEVLEKMNEFYPEEVKSMVTL